MTLRRVAGAVYRRIESVARTIMPMFQRRAEDPVLRPAEADGGDKTLEDLVVPAYHLGIDGGRGNSDGEEGEMAGERQEFEGEGAVDGQIFVGEEAVEEQAVEEQGSVAEEGEDAGRGFACDITGVEGGEGISEIDMSLEEANIGTSPTEPAPGGRWVDWEGTQGTLRRNLNETYTVVPDVDFDGDEREAEDGGLNGGSSGSVGERGGDEDEVIYVETSSYFFLVFV